MPLPEITRLELPILQELQATGGNDQLRYLYERLTGYFPQLTEGELTEQTTGGRNRWHFLVQRAGKLLETRGEIKRGKARWTITPRGQKRVEEEALQFDPAKAPNPQAPRPISHKQAQAMLVEIGVLLGHHAEAEFEYYDVVWRENVRAPRLSHVFEVQIAGSVDGALTRLKQAYDNQRSHPFLIIGDERDVLFAQKRLENSFHELQRHVTIIGIGELQRLYEALKAHQTLLVKLLAS